MPPVRILYRWRGRCALEGVLAGVRRAVVLEALEGGGRADVLETLARVGHAVVLGALSGRAAAGKENPC